MSDAERTVIEQELIEKMRKAQREYKKEWRAKNKDKVKAANDRYWRKKAMLSMEQKEG